MKAQLSKTLLAGDSERCMLTKNIYLMGRGKLLRNAVQQQ